MGKHLSGKKINAGVPQGSILGPLFFLIYMNDLTDGTSSIVKLFADDTSFFPVVQDKNNSASQLNNGLNKVSDWDYTWKMSFNPDPSKQARTRSDFFKEIYKRGSVICQSPRRPFKSILGCILMKNGLTKLI